MRFASFRSSAMMIRMSTRWSNDVMAYTSAEVEKYPACLGEITVAAATITGNIPMGNDVGLCRMDVWQATNCGRRHFSASRPVPAG